MKNFAFLENERNSAVLKWLVLGTGALIFGYSVFAVYSYPFSKFAALTVSIFVCALISKYEAKIPNTNIRFAPKIVFVFWGIISLGLPGGVLLAASAAFATHRKYRSDGIAFLSAVSRDLICAFLAAAAFNNTLGVFNGIEANAAVGLLIPNEIIIAGFLMAIVHFASSALLTYIFVNLQAGPPNLNRLRGMLLSAASGYVVSFVATVILFLTFNHFGMDFSLVVVPLAVIGNLAYKMHARSLGNKTKQISEASRIHLATVEALATAIDARDQVGMGHVRRTQIYAVGLGNILGLGSDEINALRTGALLHDIGKLAVPDHILNKPGRLTPAEMEKTKIHSSVGASILETVGFPYPVVPTVKYHHEFWDGSGYPKGLKGKNIPLTARILTVADAYDTLRGARPYRPAVSREDACNFLSSGSGTQFDPQIVATFLKNLRIFESEIEQQGLSYQLESDISRNSKAVIEDDAALNYVEQIQRANREVYTLYEMARDFSSSLNLEETLALFTGKVGEFVPFDTCLVYLLDESNGHATAAYVEGKNKALLHGRRIKVGDGATGYVLKKCKPVENVDPALDFASSNSELSRQYVAMASLPLVADGKLIGAISLYSSELAVYEEEHLRLLETISRIAADAICKSVRHAETETRALTDPMTGLPNARSLQIQFEKEFGRARRNGNNFQMLVLDLDGFKAVNDTFGHKAGDKMLAAIGGIIKKELRDYDFLARYGGDEFVAIIPETESADVMELCRRIEAAVSEFKLPTGTESFARVGVSIGSASYPNHGESFDQMIIAADKAMYLTKAFHKQRDTRLGGQMISISRLEPVVSAPNNPIPAPIDERDFSNMAFENDLIVELDESHIISYSAIN